MANSAAILTLFNTDEPKIAEVETHFTEIAADFQRMENAFFIQTSGPEDFSNLLNDLKLRKVNYVFYFISTSALSKMGVKVKPKEASDKIKRILG